VFNYRAPAKEVNWKKVTYRRKEIRPERDCKNRAHGFLTMEVERIPKLCKNNNVNRYRREEPIIQKKRTLTSTVSDVPRKTKKT